MKIIPILLLLSSCSLLKSEPELSSGTREVPDWVYAPYDACSESTELCATGEAKTSKEAGAEARKNLASIFEVKVTSEFTAHASSSQGFPGQSQVREEVQKSLAESVDQVLEAVQIKKRFKHDGLSYALASLDRTQASDLLKGRINKIDEELNILWDRRSRMQFRKIMKLYLEREKLNERYSLVAGTGLPAQMTYGQIISWKESKSKVEPVVLRIGQAPDWMTEKIKELLTEAGLRIVKGDAPKALAMNVDSIKEYMNVEGFEKYTFTLTMTSFENGEKNKVLSVSETVTGRTQTDALLKLKNFFNDYIEQHLSDLHLD